MEVSVIIVCLKTALVFFFLFDSARKQKKHNSKQWAVRSKKNDSRKINVLRRDINTARFIMKNQNRVIKISAKTDFTVNGDDSKTARIFHQLNISAN